MPLPEYRLPISARSIDWFANTSDPYLFDLDAPYQRGSVWTDEQRRNLIRSIRMGLPVGAIFINELTPTAEDEYYYRVVDGKQRIETLRAFMADGFTVPGDWFTRPSEPDETYTGDVYWSDLSLPARRGFKLAAVAVCETRLHDERTWVAEGTPGARQVSGGWVLDRTLSDAEVLAAEAELFLLINRGGTDQTDETLSRAASIAAGEI